MSTHIFSGVRNPIKALLSVLDHYNMLKHTTYTFQVVRHVLGSENHQIDYISGTGQRRINILVSTHILMWGEESNKHTIVCIGPLQQVATYKICISYTKIPTHGNKLCLRIIMILMGNSRFPSPNMDIYKSDTQFYYFLVIIQPK